MDSGIGMEVPGREIAAFSRKWHVSELALFGSVPRKDFRPWSDVNELVSFFPDARLGLFDFAGMQEELAVILGRQVDLVSRRAVQSSTNEIRKRPILESARPIYQASRLALGYVAEVTRHEFLKDVQRQDAVIRRLDIVGEPALRVSRDTRDRFSTLPWTQMVGMRNALIHQYGDADRSLVWDTIASDLPALIDAPSHVFEEDSPVILHRRTSAGESMRRAV